MRQYIISIVAIVLALCAGRAAAATESADTVYVVRTDTVYVPMTIAPTITGDSAAVQELSYERRLRHYYHTWSKLVPKGLTVQYAGNMGMFSAGPTWIYAKRHWATSLLFGFVPRHQNDRTMATFTVKQDYVPWSISLGNSGFQFQPLATGIYLNSVLDSRFWNKQPDRYPSGYYWFSTRVRTNIYIGERIKFCIPKHKRWFAESISLFYELSTCDYFFIQRVKDSYLGASKWLTLSLGLRLEWN